MPLETWVVFAATQLAAAMTPGPTVLFLLSTALARGTLASIWANVGVLAGNGVWIIISATGLGSLLLASPDLFMGVKWIGAAYLVWLGLTAFFGRSAAFSIERASDNIAPGRTLLRNAFVIQTTNPKALVFFGALMPQFIDPAHPVLPQFATLAATTMVIEFAVMLTYGALAGQATRLAGQPWFARVMNRTTGLMLIAAAIGMAALSRN